MMTSSNILILLLLNFVHLFNIGAGGAGITLQRFPGELPPPHDRYRPPGEPYFDTLSVPTNVTGVVGKSVDLLCRVRNLGNRTVSWVRHRDIHLLTVGRYTYTSDQRFESIHIPHTGDWTLRIRYPQRRDSGIYECQVSTTPPIGHSVQLTVVEPVTEITGGPELFINQGSTINLTCIVRYAAAAPKSGSVRWSHNSRPLSYDSPHGGGGLALTTERGATSTTSRLLIQRATVADSGVYSCAPHGADVAAVRVHILNGEHPAAMQHGCGSLVKSFSYVNISYVLTICLLNIFHKTYLISIANHEL